MALRIGILASTNGTDLPAVIDAIRDESLTGVEIAIVASNKSACGAILKAQGAGIQTAVVDATGKDRETFDREMATILDAAQVDLILMIGYMRLVSPWFVQHYPGKIINIHPSLLPKYPGMDRSVHEEVLAHGETETGCTLHFVDEGTDTGPIILQQKVPIAPRETVDTLRMKVQKAEQDVIVRALALFRDGKVQLSDTLVSIS